MQERQRFEENWKNAFEGAEVTPSDHLWANIELDLVGDESKKMRKRIVFYQRLAAALVLVSASLGIYVWNGREADVSTGLTSIKSKGTETSTTTTPPSSERIAKDENLSTGDGKVSPGPITKSRSTENQAKETYTRGIEAAESASPVGEGRLALVADSASRESSAVVAFEKEKTAGSQKELPDNEQRDQVEIAQVAKEMTEEEAKRIIEEYLEPVEEKTEKAKIERESLWLAMGGSAGSYHPSSGAGGSADFSNNVMQAGAMDRSGRTNQSALGSAYSFGVSFGTRISERWVIQSGLNYVNQNIDYSSNVLTFNSSNKAQLSVPEYLNSNDGITNSSFGAVTTTNPYTINSAIELVSIPVQAGYLIVDRKIGWQVNGGFSSDLFIRNTLIDESGQLERFSQAAGKDSPYRSVNWSGLVNTELSYKVGENYRVALVPGLRYAFTSILKDGTSIPLILDLGFRFRYMFK